MPPDIEAGPHIGNTGLPRAFWRCMPGAMGLQPPFVLLDDARAAGMARLYTCPVEIVTAATPADVGPALERLRAATARGLHAAGFLQYEAGADWPTDATPPLLWFGLFEQYHTVDAAAVLPDPAGAWAGAPVPAISPSEYRAQFAQVAEWIRAGDIYQANLTFRAEVPFAGHPAALYALLRTQGRGGHGALVATGETWLLSCSPELFFTLADGTLTARPMKGTAPRGATPLEDAALAAELRDDPKQRAENLMIVDLMRNDLSRVAQPGSVMVPELFTVETYPTVHQLVSAVTARVAPQHHAVDVLAALFPCGSVTGAPKRRAMQIVHAVEHGPRGAYTGAIGAIDARGDASFNVAIRTLTVRDGAQTALLGLGSGVVADSVAETEWDECLAKGRFVTAGQTPFDLIETMRFDPEAGFPLLERHLARIKASAERFGFAFDRHVARNELQAATFRLREPARVRLTAAASGAIAIGIALLPAPFTGPLRTAVVPLPVAPDDFRLAHKTSRRGFYDAARRAAGTDEVVFVDLDGFLTEGSFTSLFVARDGVLLTPPLARGLLPGVLRAELLATGRAREAELRPEDLAEGFWLGNALRDLMPAVAIAQPERSQL